MVNQILDDSNYEEMLLNSNNTNDISSDDSEES